MNLDHSYWEQIEDAKKDGYIVESQGNKTVPDVFSHRDGMGIFESRRLNPTIEEVLSSWDTGSHIRFLELGPGSGAGVSHMSHLFPNSTIHTTGGQTPINPYWRFNWKIIEQNSNVFKTIRELLKQVAPEVVRSNKYPFDVLMAVQESCGVEIFDVLDKPYIHHQFVGLFQDDGNLEKGSYDVIYENCGPNYHTRSPEMFRSTYELLAPGGILCLNSATYR